MIYVLPFQQHVSQTNRSYNVMTLLRIKEEVLEQERMFCLHIEVISL